ncbi:MAG: imelysin family protein [Myxococcota bacterium]|nr:imelysin family protein [Myxococcota bacterium]
MAVLLAACGGGEGSPDARTDNFDRSAMLAHLSSNVLLPMQAAFDAKAAALPAVVSAYCDALDAGAVGATRDAAVTAWAAAVDSWEQADAVLIGPAAMTEKDLRYKIYAWPLLAPCGLDRDTASRWASEASYDIAVQPPNERSLLAIEYLLFSTDTNHTCPLEPAGWSALAADLPRARCRLAHALAVDVAARGAQLHAAWRADGGNYVGDLANAGKSGSSIRSAQEGVNRISDGLFYVDRIVKDMKLAESAGIATNSCATVQTPCVAEVELRLSDRATPAIRANLVALRAVFTGSATAGSTDGTSFDDFLRAVGQGELADRMISNLDASIAKANALPESFVGALSSSYADVVAAHKAINLFTDDLKTQFLTVLALDIPDEVASDND